VGSQVLLRCCWAWRYAGHGEYWSLGEWAAGAEPGSWDGSEPASERTVSVDVVESSTFQHRPACKRQLLSRKAASGTMGSHLWWTAGAASVTTAAPMLACMTTWKGKVYGHACSVVWLAPLDGHRDVDLREQDLSDRRPA
jgi:hypothetical protein